MYLGVFDRAAGDAVDWFDETLIRNQDYELNIRLRAVGGTVWFDPELWVGYRPRGSIRALAKQYFEYGVWKAEVVRRHPSSLKLRQLVPAVFTLVVAAALFGAARTTVWRAAIAVYGAALATAARGRATTAIAQVTMHLAWGAGFWRGAPGAIARLVRRRG